MIQQAAGQALAASSLESFSQLSVKTLLLTICCRA
jgi:hypothetical protein